MARGETNHITTTSKKRIKIVLNLIRIDAERLYIRIKERKLEYLRIYSSERIRSHFSEIFYTRYFDLSPNDLLLISEEAYNSIESFYNSAETLRWYLGHTNDLPGAAEEKVNHFISLIDQEYQKLNSYLKAEYSTYDD